MNRKRITVYLHSAVAEKIKEMSAETGKSQGAIIDIAIGLLIHQKNKEKIR